MSKEKYVKATISLPEDLWNKYWKYCEQEGMTFSSRLAKLMHKDLERRRMNYVWDSMDEDSRIEAIRKNLNENNNFEQNTERTINELKRLAPESPDIEIYSEILKYIKKLKK